VDALLDMLWDSEGDILPLAGRQPVADAQDTGLGLEEPTNSHRAERPFVGDLLDGIVTFDRFLHFTFFNPLKFGSSSLGTVPQLPAEAGSKFRLSGITGTGGVLPLSADANGVSSLQSAPPQADGLESSRPGQPSLFLSIA
jgi:hypothetical protein